MEKRTLIDPEIEIKSFDKEKREIWHRITKEVPDRLGDIVRIDGLNLSQFKKKPAVLYGHRYAGIDPVPVVGKNIGFRREGKSLYAGTRFFPEKAELSPKLKELINDLVFLNEQKLMGWSIGFVPRKIENRKKDDKWIGYDFKESDLLEYSNVIIPAHQDAINDMISTGILSKSFSEYQERDIPEFIDQAIERMKIHASSTSFLDLGNNSPSMDYSTEYDIRVGTWEYPEEREETKELDFKTDEDYLSFMESELIVEEKPYPNEHACRLNDPGKYDKFRRGSRKHEGKEYFIIFGKKKDSDSWEQQAFRYPKDKWTASQAKSHCKDHSGSFEPASEKCHSCGDFDPDEINKMEDELISINKKRGEISELLKKIVKEQK